VRQLRGPVQTAIVIFWPTFEDLCPLPGLGGCSHELALLGFLVLLVAFSHCPMVTDCPTAASFTVVGRGAVLTHNNAPIRIELGHANCWHVPHDLSPDFPSRGVGANSALCRRGPLAVISVALYRAYDFFSKSCCAGCLTWFHAAKYSFVRL
jgi:hypothetical protein